MVVVVVVVVVVMVTMAAACGAEAGCVVTVLRMLAPELD